MGDSGTWRWTDTRARSGAGLHGRIGRGWRGHCGAGLGACSLVLVSCFPGMERRAGEQCWRASSGGLGACASTCWHGLVERWLSHTLLWEGLALALMGP